MKILTAPEANWSAGGGKGGGGLGGGEGGSRGGAVGGGWGGGEGGSAPHTQPPNGPGVLHVPIDAASVLNTYSPLDNLVQPTGQFGSLAALKGAAPCAAA